MNHVIIDVETAFKSKILHALRRLKDTESAEDGGEYYMGTAWSQIHYRGGRDAEALDAWAYQTKAGTGFVGAVDTQFKEEL